MNDRMIILGGAFLLSLAAACGKSKEPLADPEAVAQRILEAHRESAMACAPGADDEEEEPELDKAIREGDSAAISAARLGRVGAAQCVGGWSQKVIAAMVEAGVPPSFARTTTYQWVVENLGPDIALVF